MQKEHLDTNLTLDSARLQRGPPCTFDDTSTHTSIEFLFCILRYHHVNPMGWIYFLVLLFKIIILCIRLKMKLLMVEASSDHVVYMLDRFCRRKYENVSQNSFLYVRYSYCNPILSQSIISHFYLNKKIIIF